MTPQEKILHDKIVSSLAEYEKLSKLDDYASHVVKCNLGFDVLRWAADGLLTIKEK